MNLRQLEAFKATMRSGSITGAAKLLHISQPSVSRLIADLEESLGFKLFTRSGHGLVASVEARKFQQSVESMFIGLDKLKDTADAIRTTKDETIALGVIPIFAYSMMPEAVSQIRDNRSGLKIEIMVRNTPGLIDAVLLQQLDLGVICPTQHYEGIHTLYETQVPYVCLLPETHRLTDSRQAVDLAELADEEFVTLGQAYLSQIDDDQQLFRQLCGNTHIVAHSDPAIAAIARATGLLAIVDIYTANIAIKLGGVVARPLVQQLNYPISIITRSTDSCSLAATILAEALITELKRQDSVLD